MLLGLTLPSGRIIFSGTFLEDTEKIVLPMMSAFSLSFYLDVRKGHDAFGILSFNFLLVSRAHYPCSSRTHHLYLRSQRSFFCRYKFNSIFSISFMFNFGRTLRSIRITNIDINRITTNFCRFVQFTVGSNPTTSDSSRSAWFFTEKGGCQCTERGFVWFPSTLILTLYWPGSFGVY